MLKSHDASKPIAQLRAFALSLGWRGLEMSRLRMANRLNRSRHGYNASSSRIAPGDASSVRGIPNVALLRLLPKDAWMQCGAEEGLRPGLEFKRS